MCGNKLLWKVIKPLLSNEVVSNGKITLVEGTEIMKNVKQITKLDNLNNFSSNIIQNLNISQSDEANPIFDFIRDPVKTIVKYRAHPSINTVKTVPQVHLTNFRL